MVGAKRGGAACVLENWAADRTSRSLPATGWCLHKTSLEHLPAHRRGVRPVRDFTHRHLMLGQSLNELVNRQALSS